MEFSGVGKIPYDPPDSELKSFFRRKYATVFRFLDKSGVGLLKRSYCVLFVDRGSAYTTNTDEKAAYVKTHMDIYDKYCLFGRNSINEEQYIGECMRIAFSDAKAREEHMKEWRKFIPEYFKPIDTNRDGYIDYEEFCRHYKIFDVNVSTAKTVFDAIDTNGDGLISLDEFVFAFMSFYFCSGPDDTFSLFYGKVVEEDDMTKMMERYY